LLFADSGSSRLPGPLAALDPATLATVDFSLAQFSECVSECLFFVFASQRDAVKIARHFSAG
jgi:hypothetical protein